MVIFQLDNPQTVTFPTVTFHTVDALVTPNKDGYVAVKIENPTDVSIVIELTEPIGKLCDDIQEVFQVSF